MYIVIVVAFMITLTLRHGPSWGFGVAVLAPACVLYVALAGALASFRASRAIRAMQGPPALPGQRRRRALLPLLLPLYLLGGLAELHFLGLAQAVDAWPILRDTPLLAEAVMLTPFVAALAVVWLAEYPAHRLARQQLAERFADEGWQPPVWSRRQFLLFNFRHQFLFLAAPIALILLAHHLILARNLPAIFAAADRLAARLNTPPLSEIGRENLAAILAVAIAAVVFTLVPALLVRIWNTSPLPPGELRDTLLGTLRALRLRCRPPRIWHSGGVVANAGAMGLIAPLRYVLLSDSLLARMDRRQIQAVFAHEIGHIQQHHIFYSALFTLAVAVWVSLLAEWTASIWPTIDDLALQVAAVAVMAVVWGFGFGIISRRFERQSDVIAAWASGHDGGGDDDGQTGDPRRVTPEGAAVFASALRRVAQLNGISPTASNWRHGTIESRTTYVMALAVTGGTREPIDRQVKRIKLAVAAACLAAAAVGVWTFLHTTLDC
ncbi:MAG: M48 family metalloprotease [Phycisphaerae bacterium]|nr:M48 family metalloprotease [Phycisphaerae bacterium]